MKNNIFDDWPERYDRWFETPIGRLVKKYESGLVMDLLAPRRGEIVLDAGCGTGVFTGDILTRGARVVGLDVSTPMLARARDKAQKGAFKGIAGDMAALPFSADAFDKVVSVTALEFIANGENAVCELFRVCKKGGTVVVATLNRLSPWAVRRTRAAEAGHGVFSHAFFRSPEDLMALAPVDGRVETAIHFQKDDAPEKAREIERAGQEEKLMTGAFLSARWVKPECMRGTARRMGKPGNARIPPAGLPGRANNNDVARCCDEPEKKEKEDAR